MAFRNAYESAEHSRQILDLILVNFASPKIKIITSDPTFSFFEERCKLYSIPTIKIPFSKDMNPSSASRSLPICCK